uniref:Uncharacterized protein n=1 Tax=Moorena producens (strain JHB) TaxID=1454205 RepID=A0A1D9G0W9_MOOP1
MKVGLLKVEGWFVEGWFVEGWFVEGWFVEGLRFKVIPILSTHTATHLPISPSPHLPISPSPHTLTLFPVPYLIQ